MTSIQDAKRQVAELADIWVPQLAEHALFLHMMLYDADLKEEAAEIYLRWREFYCNEKMQDMRRLYQLLPELKEFKQRVLQRLLAGEWLGTAFPSFVQHILDELLYFESKLNGKVYTLEEETVFWNKINSEHAGFAAHLLDPVEEKLHDKADLTAKKIKALPIGNIVMALEAGKELTEFNKQALMGVIDNRIKSVIPESLLRHVIREGEYSQLVLGRYVNKTNNVSESALCKH